MINVASWDFVPSSLQYHIYNWHLRVHPDIFNNIKEDFLFFIFFYDQMILIAAELSQVYIHTVEPPALEFVCSCSLLISVLF